MTEIQYLNERIGVLEQALSQLIQGELVTLAPYQSQRHMFLDGLNNNCLSALAALDEQFKQSTNQS